MKKQKIDTSGTERAQQAIAQAEVAANTLKQNFAADLTTANVANVVAGGSAAEAVDNLSTGPKRKRTGSGLSSQLGIQV